MHPFTIYRNGKQIEVISKDPIGPVTCLCSTKKELFLLSDETVYRGKLEDDQERVELNQWRQGINDIEVWKNQFYIVTIDGNVLTKDISDESEDIWSEVAFIDEEKPVHVAYMKCNAVGQIFITKDQEVYGAGCCGEILTTDHPVKLKSFPNSALDVSAGEDFFIVLTTGEHTENDESFKPRIRRKLSRLKSQDTVELVLSDNGLPSSSQSSIAGSQNVPQDSKTDEDIKRILKHGFGLLTTAVCSFGASNNGVLGTGDHIKRSGVNYVLGLMANGVCSIASGKEHTLARTIDGRVFHWGLNSQNQVETVEKIKDFSAPREITSDSEEVYVLDACCGDYRTILMDLEEKCTENGREIFSLHAMKQLKNVPFILTSNQFTLLNNRNFARAYKQFLSSLQQTVRVCLRNRFRVSILMCAQKNGQTMLKFTQQLCQGYVDMLYLLASCLNSLENFYRGDEEVSSILFIKNIEEVLVLFERYTKFYCDVKSINGFTEIEKTVSIFDVSQREDFDKIFQQPFSQISNIAQFIEALIKNEPPDASQFLSVKLIQWQAFARQNRIDIELAEHTQEFWLRNARNMQIRPFKKKNRRVILDSSNVPLKLASGGKFTTNAFILFSDCLCQYGSTLQIFVLSAMWVKIDGENSLKIITPEKTFSLTARNHVDKMLWYDQLESSIMTALGRPGGKLSNIRTTAYAFSEKHSKYPGVHAFGRWRQGVMHGTCYLEYPDGKFYFGEMKFGEIEGYGKMVIPSQGLYEGSFKAGKFHGYGVYEMKDNEIYDGHFRDGLFHGHGVLRTNTYTYIGDFVANAKNGYGILDDTFSGEKYMGMFADNMRTGAGTCITMNGDYFEGVFVNNELAGDGVAFFENGNYYEGELGVHGPSGKGTYYLPSCEANEDDESDSIEPMMCGNVIKGNLGGTWDDIRVVSGRVSLNQKMPKFPKSIGQLVVDNSRKWRSLFDNFEEQIFGSSSQTNPKQLWSQIAVFMTQQRENEKTKEHESFSNPHSYFAKNITMLSNYAEISMKFSTSLDKISLKSTTSLFTKSSSNLEGGDGVGRKSHSNETLYPEFYSDEALFNSLLMNAHFGLVNGSSKRNSNESTTSSVSVSQGLEYVPNYGINSLDEAGLEAIKEYLAQAFQDPYHPLSLLNQRISNCFYTSYGCWKVKPTPILSRQAIKEWESISMRVYGIVRKLFPALPETHCCMENSREVVSHVSLLYPIVLSEGIYSTLFVLYANKHSVKDELYRQKVLVAEKMSDAELSEKLNFDPFLLNVIAIESFNEAIATLKQVKEKYCPRAMLKIFERSMELITEAYEKSSSTTVNSVILAADNIMPLTLFLVLRSGVPHLGAELALLDDLIGDADFDLEMSGLAGYCYTTIKAAYEHITVGQLFQ